MTDLAELRKLLEALPVLHVVQGMGPSDGPPDSPHEWPGTTYETQCRCSVSPSPDVHGWTTDGGYNGYGLPESVATAIVTLCNEAPALLDEVERLRGDIERADNAAWDAMADTIKAQAELERLRGALEYLADGGCSWTMIEHRSCRYRKDRDEWCEPCIARAALVPKSGT